MSRAAVALWLGALLGMTACLAAPAPLAPTPDSSPLTASASATPEATPSGPAILRLWLPPEFAPDPATPGGQALAAQLAAFEQAHPATRIDVRLKAAAGPGGLRASLLTAYNAAPDTLPDLVALQADDLAAAAQAGLLAPLDGLAPAETLADYYPFAQASARPQSKWVGLPFAADARLLVYRTEVYTTAPRTWAEVVTGTLAAPLGEAGGQTVLQDYLARGGLLLDPNGRPVLDAEILTEALANLLAMHRAGFVPQASLTYSDTHASWQVFRERRAVLAVTSARVYLQEQQRVSSAGVSWLPSDAGLPGTVAEAWTYAVLAKSPERQALTLELLLWLTAPESLAVWTQAAGVLPPRAGALDGWPNDRLTLFAAAALPRAQAQPPAAALALFGPALQTALANVLNERATPFDAAQTAARAVVAP